MSAIPNKPKRKHGLSVLERIERYRVIQAECWETSLDAKHTYPQLKVNGKRLMIHRLAYEAYIGPITSGLFVLHRCDNPRCHRPEHLFLGTAVDNMHDMVVKGRQGVRQAKIYNVALIASLCKTRSQAEVARQFGLSQSKISVLLRSVGASRGRQTSFGKGHGTGGWPRQAKLSDRSRPIKGE